MEDEKTVQNVEVDHSSLKSLDEAAGKIILKYTSTKLFLSDSERFLPPRSTKNKGGVIHESIDEKLKSLK